jgi:multidrug transporter EmrE-like cation transporter
MSLDAHPAVSRTAQVLIVLVAVLAVAVADVLLKRAALQGDMTGALRSGWMWGAIVLYLVQVSLFTYVFVAGWQLSIIGAMQTALYALVVLTAGIVLYQEALTPVQVVGIVLAIGGAVLINWP